MVEELELIVTEMARKKTRHEHELEEPMKNKVIQAEPQPFHIPLGRRRFLRALAMTSAGFTLKGYLAEALTIAPQVTQGPYYPLANNIPLDKDNDLLYLNDNLTAATGIITYLTGRVLDSSGNPISGALLEIWHADNGGNYIYSASSSRNAAADANFQGFGQFLTGSSGQYKFRTIKAGLYNGRTRHYHLAVTIPGQLTRYCTQLFWNETAKDVNGNTWSIQNANDNVFSTIPGAQQGIVNLTYTTVDAATGAVAANFDFVVGMTPIEPTYPGGSFVVAGAAVTGPTNSTRFKISIPAYANYTYEVYGNPSLGNMGNTITNWRASYLTNMSWATLPFSLTPAGAISTNKFTASSNGTLDLYLQEKAVKGFYYVSFRVPGANTGTP
jgi:protocatechuate 3,4-dioxygenase beta subunit